MKKRFIITNNGKGNYGASHSLINTNNLLDLNKNIHTLKDITDIGRVTDNIVLRNEIVFNTGVGFNGYATDMSFLDSDDFIIVGGFTEYNGVSANSIIKIKPDGSIDYNFNIGTGLVGLVAYAGLKHIEYDETTSSFYLIGSFSSYNGISANGIIKLNLDGTKDTSFDYGTGFGGSVLTYGVYSDTISSSIYVNGIFSVYKGVAANRIIKILPNGTKDTSFDNGSGGFNNAVVALKINNDGTLFASGHFNLWKGVSTLRLVKLDSSGNKILSFNPGTSFNNNNSYVNRDSGDDLYGYGYFTSYNGVTASYIVKIDPDTGLKDNSFVYGTGFNNFTNAFHKNDDGTLFIGGGFTAYNGTSSNYFIKLLPSGAVDTSFNMGTGFNNVVYGVIVRNGKVIISGDFTTYNGFVAKNIIKLNSDGSIYNGSEFSFLEGKATYNIKNLEDTTDDEILPKSLINDLIRSSDYITVTKTEIDSLIVTNSLKPSQKYLISNADVSLYGGTPVILSAITTNKLTQSAQGVFYTPKYDQSSEGNGYGIWSMNMTHNVNTGTLTGTFSINENVTGNNGATAKLLAVGLLEWISGTWSSTTSIIGDTSGASVSISSAVSPTYSIGSIVHWGGKSWINLNGNIGSSVDKYELDAEWDLLPINDVNYNVYIDDIVYDYGNDMIVSRKDRYGNEVSSNNQMFTEFIDIDGYNYGNPIKDFQWGNGQDNFNTGDYYYLGVQQNKIVDSYFDCLNSEAKYIWLNDLKTSVIRENIYSTMVNFHGNKLCGVSLNDYICSISYNVFSRGVTILGNILNQGGCIDNNIIQYNGIINYNKLNGSSLVTTNNVYLSEIANNELLCNSSISDNILNKSSIISKNILINDSVITQNDQNTSYISNNMLNNSCSIRNNTLLSASGFESNVLSNTTHFNFGVSIGASKGFTRITANGFNASNSILDVTGATAIFDNYSKTLFDNSDGVPRVSYYNISDVLVIGDVNM